MIILYESPRRVARTLTEIAGSMLHREVLVVRELTKKFEETWRGPVSDIARELKDPEIRGECALVLSCPAAEVKVPPADMRPARSRLPGERFNGGGAWRTGWPGTSRFPGDRSIRPTWP